MRVVSECIFYFLLLRNRTVCKLTACSPSSWLAVDDQKRAECISAYEIGLASLKEALTDLLSSCDPVSSEWRGVVVRSVVVLPAHCGRHVWTSEKTRTIAKGIQ